MPTARPVRRVFSPLDEELGLLPSPYSPSLVESVVRLGTRLPFEPAAQMVAHFTHTAGPKPTTRRLTEQAGAAYTVVQAQPKGAGMHWARSHVNPMLVLRTIACTDRWAEAWPQIVAQLRAQAAARQRARRQARAAQLPAAPAPSPPPPKPPQPTPLLRLPPSPTPKILNGRPTAEYPWKKHRLLAGGQARAET